MAKKKTKPRASTLANFKGTRKQLAKRYGVSERTIYRWINKAKEKGTEIQSREKRSKYPGASILDEQGTNKEIADRYGVSTRTITRWRSRAIMESEPREVPEYKPEEQNAKQWGEPTEEPWEVPEPEIEEPWEVPEPDLYEVIADEYTGSADISKDLAADLGAINALLYDNDLLTPDSIFNDLTYNEKIEKLNKYIEKCIEDDPEMFYNKETGEYMDTSPEFVSTINIWGDKFEKWLIEQQESDLYEV